MKKFSCCVADPNKLKIPMAPTKISSTIPDMPDLTDLPSVPDVSLPKLPDISNLSLLDLPVPNLPNLNLMPLKKAVDNARRLVKSLLKQLGINPKFLIDCWVSAKGIITMWMIYILVIWIIEVYMIPLVFCLVLMKNFIILKCPNISMWLTEKFGNIIEINVEDESQAQDDDNDESMGQSLLKAILTPLIALQGLLLKAQQLLELILTTGDRFMKLVTWDDPALTGRVAGGLAIFTVLLAVFSPRFILIISGSLGFLKLLRDQSRDDENSPFSFLQKLPSPTDLIARVSESSKSRTKNIETTELLKTKTD